MLTELTIKDFAIIDHLQMRLDANFNVFTGETGAGKSIIIDAVNALSGGKIGAEFVRAGCERATVEGVFWVGTLPTPTRELQPPSEIQTDTMASSLLDIIEQGTEDDTHGTQSADSRIALAHLLQQYDIEPEEGQLVLTRVIFPSGRTVARINGRAFSPSVLQQVSSWLIDIHGQSENMSLLRPDQHVNFLDRYAETLPLREALSKKVLEWRNARKELQALLQNTREQERRAEFLRFEIEEIEKAELKVGEEEELEDESRVLSSAERLRELCELIHGAIEGSEMGSDNSQSALDLLRGAQRDISELARLDTHMDEYVNTLAEAVYQLEDVASAVSSYEADIEDDPRRLSDIEYRLDQINKLKRKYGSSIEDILAHAARSRAELETIENRDELIARLEKQDGLFRQDIGQLAQRLSERRRAATHILSTSMEEQLNDLNMRRARFQVEFLQEIDANGVPASLNGETEHYYTCGLTGIDHVQFLIAPNPGEPFKPLTRIASGGETSRLMLALKTILADADATPTLIFDEIDAGISGTSGRVVGEKLWQLTRNHQIICVTHLPQIAAFADTHYNVNKQIFANRTTTIVNELRTDQRIREIAHIMGGTVSEVSLKSAEEMLGRSNLWKENWLRQQSVSVAKEKV